MQPSQRFAPRTFQPEIRAVASSSGSHARACRLHKVAAVLLRMALLASIAPSASAADFFVDSLDDRIDDDVADAACHTAVDTCTLRAAIMQANRDFAIGSASVIHVPAGTYLLTRLPAGNDDDQTGDLNLAAPFAANQTIAIVGAGAGSTVIDANQTDRAFTVESGRVATLAELTVRNGNHAASNSGGGIFSAGTLALSHCVIEDNSTNYGGGIANTGVMNIADSTIESNTAFAWGGGLALFGTTTIRRSTIRGNTAASGGGLMIIAHDLYMVNSTLSGNVANQNGGGIYSLSAGASLANAFLYNVSILFNDADNDHDENGGIGGGTYADGGGRFLVKNTLITGNTRLGGYVDDDCIGTLEAYGLNLLGDLSGCAFTGNGTVARGVISPTTIDATLRDNGGPTFTHALLSGSPAINAAPSGCADETGAPLATDQRGAPRIAGVRCDVGAFEYGSVVPVDDMIFSDGFEGGEPRKN
jgi:hypothetical protein